MRFFSVYGFCSVAVVSGALIGTGLGDDDDDDGGFFIDDPDPRPMWAEWWYNRPLVDLPADDDLAKTSPTVRGRWKFPTLGNVRVTDYDYDTETGRFTPHKGIGNPMKPAAFIEIEANATHLELIGYNSPPHETHKRLANLFGKQILPAAVFMILYANRFNPDTLESGSMVLESVHGTDANTRLCKFFSRTLYYMGFRSLNGEPIRGDLHAKTLCYGIAKRCSDEIPTECTVKLTRADGTPISLPIVSGDAHSEMWYSRYTQTTVDRK